MRTTGTTKVEDKIYSVNQMKSLATWKINKSLESMAFNMKILVYQTAPDLMDILDVNNNKIFLEPLLFGYFNNLESKKNISITQVLYGYIKENKRPPSIKIFFDQNSAYLPNLGTIKLLNDKKTETANLIYENSQFRITGVEGESLSFYLHPLLLIDGFEIIMVKHSFFDKYFHQLSSQVDFDLLEIEKITNFQINNVKRAISLIEKYCPEFYRIAKLTNFKMLLFDYPSINSFATKDLFGMIFLSSSYINTISSYIDDLVHQWAHNILNALIFDLSKYFKIDVERTPIAPYSNIVNDHRDIYGTFHGLFTVAQRTSCFKAIYFNEKELNLDERQELIARYCDQQRRFRNSLQNLPIEKIYTKKGMVLYYELDQMAFNCLEVIDDLLQKADFSNQVSRFSYVRFCENNNFLNII